jgi:branched-chain amino acid transport system ATP-binding protein
MSEKAVLEAKDISINFGRVQALMDVNVSVKGDEILGLVGPNGAGKTVFLNCLCGIYTPRKGRIRYEGYDITGFPPHKLARMGIGRCFQHIELFSNLTVLENIIIGRHVKMKNGIFSSGLYWWLGRDEEIAAREKAEEIIEFLDLYTYRNMKVASLAYGIQKIVGLGRALAMDPKILLLDEVGSGLNREEKEDLARFLLRIKYVKNIPIIWVEHDMELVVEITDRLVCFNYGRKIGDGPAKEVVNDSEVIKVYTGA